MGYEDWEHTVDDIVSGDQEFDAARGDFNTIPVIDVGDIGSNELLARRKVAESVRDACIKVGFFYIENHSISLELIDKVFRYAKQFFNRSFEEKMEIYIDNSPNFRGYTPVGGSGKPGPDGKGNLNEAFDWGIDSKLNDDPGHNCDSDPWMKGRNQWPRGMPGFEECMTTYYSEVRRFCRSLARIIALSLELPEAYFDSRITHPGCSAVLAHYPPQERNSLSRGLNAHTDSEFFTILAPGSVRALEVANRSGQWISAPPRPGTFIVNVGDQLQQFTNGLYVSTRHRVMNYTGQERYSIPFFFSTNYEYVIETAPEFINTKSTLHFQQVPAISSGQQYKEMMIALHRVASAVPEFLAYRKALSPI